MVDTDSTNFKEAKDAGYLVRSVSGCGLCDTEMQVLGHSNQRVPNKVLMEKLVNLSKQK